jgi:16S rRNA processing protein RimM
LWTYTEDPIAITRYGPLEAEDGSRNFEIAALRPAKGHLVARLRGVDDRDAAERLTNIKLYVARERLPAPADDEFYHVDLVGLAAVDMDGGDRGRVVAVHDFGAGILLEIQPQQGASMLLPFTTAAVPTVDIAGGKVVIVPPEETVEKAPSGKD